MKNLSNSVQDENVPCDSARKFHKENDLERRTIVRKVMMMAE